MPLTCKDQPARHSGENSPEASFPAVFRLAMDLPIVFLKSPERG